MNVKMSGVIVQIFPAEIVGASFEKRVFWLREEGVQYPNTYQMEMHQNDCNTLDNFKEGDLVGCEVDIRGRHYRKGEKEGVINTLKCWRIIKLMETYVNPPAHQPRPAAQNNPPAPTHQHETHNPNDDDLPF